MAQPKKMKSKYSFLAYLFHFRWAVPVLARLHVDRGAKFITLVSRLDVSKHVLYKIPRRANANIYSSAIGCVDSVVWRVVEPSPEPGLCCRRFPTPRPNQ